MRLIRYIEYVEVWYLHNISHVLILLNKMVYESTAPGEALRFAKYYRKKGLDVRVVLWGPTGVLLAKSGKNGLPSYDNMIQDCLVIGVKFKCCSLACKMIGLDKKELIHEIEMIKPEEVAELILKYQQDGQLFISL